MQDGIAERTILFLNFICRQTAVAASQGYRLIIIKEDEVPLSSGVRSGNSTYLLLFAVICAFLITAVTLYAARRRQLCVRLSRLRHLKGIERDGFSMSLKKLNDEITVYEGEYAEIISSNI